MREAIQKDIDTGSFYMKTAIANKQHVITKNVFAEFTVSKFRFLHEAAVASEDDVLGRSKKPKKSPPLQSLLRRELLSLF